MSFDAQGDLWIRVDLTDIPDKMKDLTGMIMTAVGEIPGTYKAVVEFNLTKYIRRVVEETSK